jgi:hypothetical protein
MTTLNSILVLLATLLAVFWEAAFNGIRHLVGAQIDLLPALIVYASLCTRLSTMTLVAVLGGLLFDTLSANPLGITVPPVHPTRTRAARRASRAMRPGIGGEWRCPGHDGSDAADLGPPPAAGLGIALAVDRDGAGRSGGDSSCVSAFRVVRPRTELPPHPRTQFSSRPRNPKGAHVMKKEEFRMKKTRGDRLPPAVHSAFYPLPSAFVRC